MTDTVKWWQSAVAYQIYPKSFKDSNQDGIGDLNGIIEKLDYLSTLGINMIWLSPINESPMVDNGYDISDYYKIDPSFGTNEDMYRLIDEAKKRNIRVIMDLVVNHCSDQNRWFQEAIKNPEGEFADYFYFRKGEQGKAPNNWRSIFGGSAWEQVPNSEYYYLHLFAKEQPDLNWENPKLRKAIYEMMNFWLEKGICGFRLDAITYLKKEPGLPSYEADGKDGLVSVAYGALNRPGIQDFLREMRDETYGNYDSFTVGEAAVTNPEEVMPFISLQDGCFSSIFEFGAINIDMQEPNYSWYHKKKWNANDFRQVYVDSQLSTQPGGWISNVIENHDLPRAANLFLPESDRNYYGKSMLATVYMYLRGTPFIYQGQEIGMENLPFASIEDYDDCSSINQYEEAVAAGIEPKEALRYVQERSRDNARYPMSWSNEKYAGFSDVKPWLPVSEQKKTINVKDEIANADSLFHFYQNLISIKRSEAYEQVLAIGEFQPILEEIPCLIGYTRSDGEKTLTVLCNFQNKECRIPKQKIKKLLVNNYKEIREEETMMLYPYQAVVFENA